MAKVLIIEDNPSISLILKEILSTEGHTVNTVVDGYSALEKLKETPLPDIVLLDYFMPGMNGQDFIKEMRTKPSLKNIPVIVVTGADLSLEDFQKDDCQAIIKKPFDLNEVVEKVKNLL
ncbi:MAG: hypothetical protein PWP31_1797 [Clostridia bacterium]|nr:hypothetical protein [Clostridia bacterium]